MKTFNKVLALVFFVFVSILNTDDAQAQERLILILEGETHSFQSHNYPDHYLRHRNGVLELTKISSELDKKDATFKVVKGLWGEGTISLESVNFPGHYLRHQNFVLKLHKATPDDLFKKDASFKTWQSVIDENQISFESINYPGYYIRHQNFKVYLQKQDKNVDLYNKDITFDFPGALVK